MDAFGANSNPYFANWHYQQNLQGQNMASLVNQNLAKRQFEQRPNFNLQRPQPTPLGFNMAQLNSLQQGNLQDFPSQSNFGFPGDQNAGQIYNDVYSAQYSAPFTGSPYLHQPTPMQPQFQMNMQQADIGYGNMASPAPMFANIGYGNGPSTAQMYGGNTSQMYNGPSMNGLATSSMAPSPRQAQKQPTRAQPQNRQGFQKTVQHNRGVSTLDYRADTLAQKGLPLPLPAQSIVLASRSESPEDDDSPCKCPEPKYPNATYPNPLPITATHNVLYPEYISTKEQENALMKELLEGDGNKARKLMESKDILPFEDAAGLWGPAKFGVVKIGNIPYAVTKQEIIHFIGRNAKMIPNERGCPIHIIMERSTSKTMDCYVEFLTHEDAAAAVRKYWHLVESNKPPRLGTRHIDMDLSSQDELLKDLFPRAKCVTWKGGFPIVKKNTDPYSTGYQGMFTSEEMVGLMRHAEHPQRSPFSTKCLQRTYECMISTLYKFPWHATHLYSIGDRNLLIKTYMVQLHILVRKVEHENIVGLDMKLFNDFLYAGLNCPTFTERFKNDIIVASGRLGANVRVSTMSGYWPFDTVSRKQNQNDDFIQFYMNLVERGVAVTDLNYATAEFFSTNQPESYLGTGVFSNMQFVFKEEKNCKSWVGLYEIESTLMLDLVTNGMEHLLKERAINEKPHRAIFEQIQGATTSRKNSNPEEELVIPTSARSISALHSGRGSAAAQNKPRFDPEGLCSFPLEVETIHEEDEEAAV